MPREQPQEIRPHRDPPPGLWTGQAVHVAGLGLLLAAVWGLWNALARPAPLAFWLAVAVPVAHQIYVWLAWRWALRTMPPAGRPTAVFRAYLAGFFLAFAGRFASLIGLAAADAGSLGLPMGARVAVSVLLAVPAGYALYSVARHFGMARAAGADHFDPRYRDLPLVDRGIFRFTSNGMYVYAFLAFWAIATAFDSAAALAVAGFCHGYIWVHYHATEKPDMAWLYGRP